MRGSITSNNNNIENKDNITDTNRTALTLSPINKRESVERSISPDILDANSEIATINAKL